MNVRKLCERCSRVLKMVSEVRHLPANIVINTQIKAAQLKAILQQQAEAFNVARNKMGPAVLTQQLCFEIPQRFCVVVNSSGVMEVLTDSLLEAAENAGRINGADVFELSSVVSNILKSSTKSSIPHFVSQIAVPSSSSSSSPPSSSSFKGQNWFLFNDPLVFEEIDPLKSVFLVENWKVPCVLLYSKRNARGPTIGPTGVQVQTYPAIPRPLKPITSSTFLMGQPFVSINRREPPLLNDLSLLPSKADILALDAEFVCLSSHRKKPSHSSRSKPKEIREMSLARVTVLLDKTPPSQVQNDPSKADKKSVFSPDTIKTDVVLDDYIVAREPIASYLTEYSGITAGDLDPLFSQHHVTTLKSTYLKLRFLIDSGCRFVGHALHNDFRIINVVVPKTQIIDTAQLFHLTDERLFSLKFLATHLLHRDIQVATHSSSEDALTALCLYQYFRHLQMSHVDVVSTLRALYKINLEGNLNPSSVDLS